GRTAWGEGEHELDGIGRGALLSVLDPAPDEEKEDEDGDGVEVDFSDASDGVEGSPETCGQKRECDWDVEVRGAGAQRGEGTGEEDASRPDEHDNSQR